MGSMLLPRVLTQQPQEGFALNFNNPIVRALSFAWVASAPDVNLVTGKAATAQGTVTTKAPCLNRLGRKFVGSGSIDFGNTPETNFGGLSQQTVLAEVFIPDTSLADGYVFGRVQGGWDYHLQVSKGSQQFAYAAGGDAGGVVAPVASVGGGLLPFQGRPVPLVGTYDKTNQKIYVDGALKNTKAYTGAFSTSGDPFAIGARGGGNQTSATGIYVSLVLIFKRVLTDAEILSVSKNPWQLFSSGSSVSSAYRAAIASAGGVSAPVAAAFTGSASATAYGIGALSSSIPLSGTAQAVAAALATLTTTIPLSGAASATASGTGALSTAIPLSGSVIATASGSATLSTAIRFAGAASATASGAGVLNTAIPLSGSASATATTSASLAGGPAALSGAAQVIASSSGALSTAILLSGAAQASATASASLAGGPAALTGTASVTASGAGALSTAIAMSGAAQVVATASASLSGSGVILTGSASVTASVVGALSTAIRLTGAAQVVATVSATFAGSAAALSGSAIVAASGQASLSTAIRLDGVASSRAAGSGQLMTWISLTGAGTASAIATGRLTDALILFKPENVLRVAAENRILRVSGENRILKVGA